MTLLLCLCVSSLTLQTAAAMPLPSLPSAEAVALRMDGAARSGGRPAAAFDAAVAGSGRALGALLRASLLADAGAWQPFEQRLRGGTIGFLRHVRRHVRRFIRLLQWTGRQWLQWTVRAAVFTLVVLLASLVDRGLLRTWRAQGLRGARAAAALTLAVYLRLLTDRRAPAIGKWLLLVAITYGVVPGDVLPDRFRPLGLVDDVAFVALASRCFMRMCADPLVDEHVRKVGQRRAGSGRGRAGAEGPRMKRWPRLRRLRTSAAARR